MNVWVQKSSYLNYKKDELPFIPHIDKNRVLKVMIYLNKVDNDLGPITFIKAEPIKYENLRNNLKEDYYLKKENKIKNFEEEDLKSITGDIGNVIIFDTNCPHFAGKINNKYKERNVYRFQFQYA